MPSRRVFLVEDSPVIRTNLIDTLEELSPVEIVGWAERKSDAVEWMEQHPEGWDLLVIDIFLKQGSGLGVLEACRDREPRRKAVVFSNYATVDLRQKCMELGADAVFDKSNEIEQLIHYCSNLPEAA